MIPAAWTPVLEGAARERALAAAVAIAGSQASRPPVAPFDVALAAVLAQALEDAGLTRGADDPDAAAWLERAFEAAAAAPPTLGLLGGTLGVAWATQHLRGRAWSPGPDGDDEPTAELDAALHARLAAPGWDEPYDLVDGLVGAGVYLLGRARHSEAARAALPELLRHLEALAEHDGSFTRWRTRPAHMELARTADPYPIYVVGPSHGAAGALVVLAGLAARGIAPERTRPLLAGARAWILARRLPRSAAGSFPLHEGNPRPKAISWCLGDLGIARALHLAGTLAGEPGWQRDAVALALDVAGFPPAETRIDDASLCHGAAGMGLLFQRFHADSGEPRFADAARAWYEHALSLRDDDPAFAGFYHFTNRGAAEARERDGSFLLGAGGVALALLAAVGERAPAWDELLLASAS